MSKPKRAFGGSREVLVEKERERERERESKRKREEEINKVRLGLLTNPPKG